jgi:dihydrodipicolinate synthase/N-acetylneuraminate lyase
VPQTRGPVSGALAAAATPLRDDGTLLDEDAFEPLLEFLSAGGVSGILALGTTGEGIALSPRERRRATRLFVQLASDELRVLVHCGAQTTIETAELAAFTAEEGAAGIAVIAPPYFPLDDRALLDHFTEAAKACAPAPFYVYELERASGYAVPPVVIASLRERVDNLVGLKVSDTPWERFAPYLVEGLDIFVGAEGLIDRAIAAGAAGAVSALATAFPEAVVAAVADGDAASTQRLADLRAAVERFPRHAALKCVLAARGLPIRQDVRKPLRQLTDDERREFENELPRWFERASVKVDSLPRH